VSDAVAPRPPVIFLGGGDVEYSERAPGPDLAPWVQSFWRLRCVRATVLRVPPDGCMDIIDGDVVGSLSSVLYARLEPGDETVGVRLRPGAFTTLFGVPADELADVRVPLADVVRPRGFLEAVRDADRPDPLAAAALRQPDIRRLSRESGYSERHLRRRVVASTGHNPRKLARIGRMQALLAAGRGESWARTAVEFGYYDESHMINDIRSLAGATPQTLLAERARAA
jgi:AraC-like DNA-binding protein